MGQTEYKIFIILATVIWLVFINGIFIFVFQYRKRKVLYDKEKQMISAQHASELLNKQLEIQQQTMQDIGREIHDNVGQRLTLASIYANHLAYDNQYPGIRERVAEVGKIINESLAELRSLSKSLTNSDTDPIDLKELVQNECNRVNGLNTCLATCHFTNASFSISTLCKNFIVRIIQEFIQNSLKHSTCNNITLDLNYTDKGLTITAADDGVGFRIDDNTAGREKGIGLSNIKKRADLLGADLSITSEPNKGVTMTIFIPINKLNTD